MKNLQLPLIRKWFDMTNPNGKTEDYREINEYWFKRLFEDCENEMIPDILECMRMGWNVDSIEDYFLHCPKRFTTNTMTLGYPKSTDTSRIKVFKHAGIEIRTGNTEWGAIPNKLYFVIKHGELVK